MPSLGLRAATVIKPRPRLISLASPIFAEHFARGRGSAERVSSEKGNDKRKDTIESILQELWAAGTDTSGADGRGKRSFALYCCCAGRRVRGMRSTLMQPEEILAWANEVRSKTSGVFQINLWIPIKNQQEILSMKRG